MSTRAIAPDDLPFLWDMLWEAVAVDAGMRELGKDVALRRPENTKYLEHWGRPGDGGVVALDPGGGCVGAAWYRRFPREAPGYGFVAETIPEMAIGVLAAARGQGTGTALLAALLDLARDQGEPAVSLSVDRRNRAFALYQRCGFQEVMTAQSSAVAAVMLITFEPIPSQ